MISLFSNRHWTKIWKPLMYFSKFQNSIYGVMHSDTNFFNQFFCCILSCFQFTCTSFYSSMSKSNNGHKTRLKLTVYIDTEINIFCSFQWRLSSFFSFEFKKKFAKKLYNELNKQAVAKRANKPNHTHKNQH